MSESGPTIPPATGLKTILPAEQEASENDAETPTQPRAEQNGSPPDAENQGKSVGNGKPEGSPSVTADTEAKANPTPRKEIKITPQTLTEEAGSVAESEFMRQGIAAKAKFDKANKPGISEAEQEKLLTPQEQAAHTYYALNSLAPGDKLPFKRGQGITLYPTGNKDNPFVAAANGSLEIIEVHGTGYDDLFLCFIDDGKGGTRQEYVSKTEVKKAQLLSQPAEYNEIAGQGAKGKVVKAYIESVRTGKPVTVSTAEIAEAGRESGMITAESGRVIINGSKLSDEEKASLIEQFENQTILSPGQVGEILAAVDTTPAAIDETKANIGKVEDLIKQKEIAAGIADPQNKAQLEREAEDLRKVLAEQKAKLQILERQQFSPADVAKVLSGVYSGEISPEQMTQFDAQIRGGNVKEFVETLIPKIDPKTEKGKKLAEYAADVMKYGSFAGLIILALMIMKAIGGNQ